MDASSVLKKTNTQTLSNRKMMSTVFWNRMGLLMAEFMELGITITEDSFIVKV